MLFMLLFTWETYAHTPTDGLVHGGLGAYLYQTHSYYQDFNSPILGGWSLIAEGDLGKYGGLELTLIYMNPIFVVERDDKKVIERVKRMYIAMGYRHWFNRDWSLSPSFFSSYVMGDARMIRNDFPQSNPPSTSARDGVDYGFALSAQYETFREEHFAVVLDARYSYSVTPKYGEDSNHYGLMVFFKYFIQGKQAEEPDPDDL